MASIRRRELNNGNAVWDVQYRDPHGRSRSKSFKEKRPNMVPAEARRFREDVEADKRRGEWRDPRLGRKRFGDFAQTWLETTANLKPSARADYEMLLRVHVLPYFGKAPLAEIERGHVQAWIAKLQKNGRGAGTIRKAYRLLSRVLREAEYARMIVANPARNIPLPKSVKQEMAYLPPDDLHAVADAVPERFRALVLVAGYLGPRFGELAALRVEDVNLLRRRLYIRRALSEVNGPRLRDKTAEEAGLPANMYLQTPKNGKEREIAIPSFLVKVLGDHIGTYAPGGGFVFTMEKGAVLSKNFSKRYFKPAIRSLGIAPIRFHDLRHTAASMAIRHGADVKVVQEMLGHASAAMTLDVYSHLFSGAMDELANRLDSAYTETVVSRRG
jgi:integrase